MDESKQNLTTSDIADRTSRAEAARGGGASGNPQRTAQGGGGGTAMQPEAPLFRENEVTDLRARWDNIQASFVDEPRKAVEQADQLVATTMKRLADIFSSERENLERQWDRGDNISTEDLRLAIQRYRSFFARLLSV